MRYQLLVIGSDPAGREAAVAAAARGVRVAVVEQDAPGGAERVADRIDRYRGLPRFVGLHLVDVAGDGHGWLLEAERIVLACGTRAARPSFIPFDGRSVLDTDEIQRLEAIPRSLLVVGAGQSGLREAIAFATLGTRVTIFEAGPLPEPGTAESGLLERAWSLGVELHTGQEVIGIDRLPQGPVQVHLVGGRRIAAETVLYAAGRVGDTGGLNLPAAGIEPDERGRIWCNADQQTWMPHIYAAGDVVGFPRLERTAADQGRHAIEHAFGPSGNARRVSSPRQSGHRERYAGTAGGTLIAAD